MSFSRIRGSGLWIDNSTILALELETLDENLSNAIDGKDGGAYAPTNPIEIGGDGLAVTGLFEADDFPRLDDAEAATDALEARVAGGDSNLFHKIMPLHAHTPLNAGWAWSAGNYTCSATSPVAIDFPLGGWPASKSPNSRLFLRQVSVALTGAAGHVGLPSLMPNIKLWKSTALGTTQLGSTVDDSSANTTAYQAWHDITLTLSPGHELDFYNPGGALMVQLNSEGGTNALAGLVVSAIKIVVAAAAS